MPLHVLRAHLLTLDFSFFIAGPRYSLARNSSSSIRKYSFEYWAFMYHFNLMADSSFTVILPNLLLSSIDVELKIKFGLYLIVAPFSHPTFSPIVSTIFNESLTWTIKQLLRRDAKWKTTNRNSRTIVQLWYFSFSCKMQRNEDFLN